MLRVPEVALYDVVRLLAAMVWPAAIQVFGMPAADVERLGEGVRPGARGRQPGGRDGLHQAVLLGRRSATRTGQAPNSGGAWLPIHGLLGLGPLPLASHQAFGPPVVVSICHA